MYEKRRTGYLVAFVGIAAVTGALKLFGGHVNSTTVALGLLLVGVGAETLLRAALRRSRALPALPSRGPSNAATPPGTAAEGAP